MFCAVFVSCQYDFPIYYYVVMQTKQAIFNLITHFVNHFTHRIVLPMLMINKNEYVDIAGMLLIYRFRQVLGRVTLQL